MPIFGQNIFFILVFSLLNTFLKINFFSFKNLKKNQNFVLKMKKIIKNIFFKKTLFDFFNG
jgi:hypothetical protein